jgi:hypothetical protein
MSAMKSQYGAKKGERVFYASRNAGKIKGVDPESRAEGGHVEFSDTRPPDYGPNQPPIVPSEWPPPMFPLPPREPRPPKRAHGGHVDGHEAREKELIGELARMNRHRAQGGPVGLQVSQFPGQHRRRAEGGKVTPFPIGEDVIKSNKFYSAGGFRPEVPAAPVVPISPTAKRNNPATRAEGGKVKPQSLYNVATAPPDPMAGAGAMGEQNPSIQAMMRMHRERQRAMPRALGGPVTSSTPSRQALMREQRNQGPGTLGEVSDVMMQQQRLLNPLYGRPAPNAPPGYAHGGKAGHAPYLVGEKGPELMVPDTPGTIIPNHELRRLVKKYGGRRVHR